MEGGKDVVITALLAFHEALDDNGICADVERPTLGLSVVGVGATVALLKPFRELKFTEELNAV